MPEAFPPRFARRANGDTILHRVPSGTIWHRVPVPLRYAALAAGLLLAVGLPLLVWRDLALRGRREAFVRDWAQRLAACRAPRELAGEAGVTVREFPGGSWLVLVAADEAAGDEFSAAVLRDDRGRILVARRRLAGLAAFVADASAESAGELLRELDSRGLQLKSYPPGGPAPTERAPALAPGGSKLTPDATGGRK